MLFVALYGETRLPEAVYNFDNQAGPILVRALALAEYRIAADYVNDRINTMITAYFNRLVDWKTTIPCAPNHLLLETHKKYIAEINDTFIAYRDSNIRRRKFPLQSFGHLIALHCPPMAWEIFQSEVDEELARRVGTSTMYLFNQLNIGGNNFERVTFSMEGLSLFRFDRR